MAGKGKKINIRDFPSISSVLEDDRLKTAIARWSFEFVSMETKRIAAALKKDALKTKVLPRKDNIISEIEKYFSGLENDLLKPVINGTGVILHTNLGRAPLDGEIYEQLRDAVCGYSNLEFDVSANKRSKRGAVAGKLAAALSGTEYGMLVNNNAASVYIIVANLADGKEVIISRGQLVQIGGGFRIPEIIERTGAKLKEIGTTNKTSLADYKKAINKNTGLVLIVHKSNFVQKGFTDEPEPSKIVEIARQKKIPVCYDLGSGLLSIEKGKSVADEPDIRLAVRSGADLVCYSGDKLLGGPQGGIIVGKKRLISALLKDPLYRVVRPDKLTIGMMEQTLLKYVSTEKRVSTWKIATASLEKLQKRAESIIAAVGRTEARMIKMKSSFGGGSLPDYDFESVGVRITGDSLILSRRLREYQIPIISRTSSTGIAIDLRTVMPEQDSLLINALKSCLS